VRCTQFYEDPEVNRRFLNAIDSYEGRAEVVNDEEAEQVFSRKDRKAYRVEVLGGEQRTKTKRGHARGKKSQMGKEGSTKAKGRS
jgi:hypothetical protein